MIDLDELIELADAADWQSEDVRALRDYLVPEVVAYLEAVNTDVVIALAEELAELRWMRAGLEKGRDKLRDALEMLGCQHDGLCGAGNTLESRVGVCKVCEALGKRND